MKSGGTKKRGKAKRFYRHLGRTGGWVRFETRYRETDLWIRAREDLSREAHEAVLQCRYELERYASDHPQFLKSLAPLSDDDPFAPALVRRMLRASAGTGVGPMAAVAGAIAQYVAEALRESSPAVIVENGGDCYLDVQEDIKMGVYAGSESPFTDRMALRFPADRFPLAVCTSSGTIGHSLSFGRADMVTVIAKDCALADAAATALANLVDRPFAIKKALDRAARISGVEGCLVLMKDKMGAWGDIEVIPA